MLNEEIIINELVNPELNDWNKISKYQYLTEEFIEKHQNELNWRCISRYQKLSGEFIEKYKNKIDWEQISAKQELSEELDRKSTRLNSSHANISYAVFCLKKKNPDTAKPRLPYSSI